MKTIKEVLDYAEKLNEVAVEGFEIELKVDDIESDEDLKAIAKQENGNLFKPSLDLPYYWCCVKLGNVDVTLRGINKEVKLIF